MLHQAARTPTVSRAGGVPRKPREAVLASAAGTSSTQNSVNRDFSLLSLTADISQVPGSQKGTGPMSDL